MKKLLFALLTLTSTSSFGQLLKIKELALANISIGSVDRLGNFYFVLSSGKLQKYDPDGNLLDETTDILKELTLIEPWNPLKVFVYSNKTTKYQHLDRHLAELEEKVLEPSLSITPLLVCPDNEVNKAWVLDVADFTLKKVNLSDNQIELDTRLPKDWSNENSNFVFMREYQNRIFLLDKNKGILMLNNLGIPITSIETKGLSFFNFLGEELCYRKDNEILLLDLFTGDIRIAATLDNPSTITTSILTDERLVLVYGNKVEILQLKAVR